MLSFVVEFFSKHNELEPTAITVKSLTLVEHQVLLVGRWVLVDLEAEDTEEEACLSVEGGEVLDHSRVKR